MQRLRVGIVAVTGMCLAMTLPACAHPVTIGALQAAGSVMPQFLPDQDVFVAADGARLGLSVWPAEGTDDPDYVVVGVHGMSDYAGAFHMAAPYWDKHGVTTYAYDQRGFGRSPNKGYWPDEELMRQDLRTAVDVARQRHPDAVITVVGVSMGASVALTAFGSDDPPKADRLILSGPGLRGWGAINPLYRVSLYASAHTNPGWIVVPPVLIDAARARMGNLFLTPPVLAQQAGLQAFEESAELDGHVATYRRNRQLLLDALPALGLASIAPPDGAFYLYADISHLTDDSLAFCHRLLQDTGVATAPGIDFDPAEGHHFIRFSFAVSTDRVEDAIARMVPWFQAQGRR